MSLRHKVILRYHLVIIMRIILYNKKYKNAVFQLHKLALQKECAFVLSGKWDQDLNEIEDVYLKKGTFLLGLIRNRLVAMGAFRPFKGKTAEVKRMRVHPQYQRQGLGQIIYNELEKKAREMGFHYFILDTTTPQISAQNFYIKNGFHETHRQKTKLMDGNLIFYKKRLAE